MITTTINRCAIPSRKTCPDASGAARIPGTCRMLPIVGVAVAMLSACDRQRPETAPVPVFVKELGPEKITLSRRYSGSVEPLQSTSLAFKLPGTVLALSRDGAPLYLRDLVDISQGYEDPADHGRPPGNPDFRVGRLAAACRPPLSVHTNTKLSQAATLMLMNDLSQPPVIDGNTLKGVMHFDPEPLSHEEILTLRNFWAFLDAVTRNQP